MGHEVSSSIESPLGSGLEEVVELSRRGGPGGAGGFARPRVRIHQLTLLPAPATGTSRRSASSSSHSTTSPNLPTPRPHSRPASRRLSHRRATRS